MRAIFRAAVLSLVATTAVLMGTFVATPAYASTSICMEDGGLRIQLCIWQDTVVHYVVGGNEYVQVKDYRFRATNIGGRQVTMSGGYLRMLATVYGTCVSGCSGYRTGMVQQSTVSNPVSGRTYTLPVAWRNSVIRIDRGATNSVQAARADVKYYFRGAAKLYHSESLCTGTTTWGLCAN